jgi:hypothetical protein
MIFSSEALCRILEKNFGYIRCIDDVFKNVLELNPIEAFRYSAITNSPYLLDEHGYSPFGKLITFNHRNYSLNTGLFDLSIRNGEINLLNAPMKLFVKFPNIFKKNKKLILIDTKTSNVESEIFSKLVEAGIKPENYLITKVKSTASELEHFFEFIACKLFSHLGYYCETQVPWSYHGRPDFAAYKSPIFNELISCNLISNGGFLIDLTMIPLINEIKTKDFHKKYEIVIGETKSKSQKSQILRYLDTGICDWAIEIMPNKLIASERVGLLRIKNDFKPDLILPNNTSNSLCEIKLKDHEWFQNYVKSFLLSNIPEKELIKLIETKSPNNTASSKDLIITIKNTSIDEILKFLKW